VAGVVSTLWMQPVMRLTFDVLDVMLYPFAYLSR
jgi:hypothetical protein